MMDAAQKMYAAYEKYIADHRLEDEQAVKTAFIEGYYQGMKRANTVMQQELTE